MSKIEGSHAAFPHTEIGGARNPGMDMRAYIAAKVLAGIGTWTPTYDINGIRHAGMVEVLYSPDALKARAEWAVAQADALIAALSEPRHDR